MMTGSPWPQKAMGTEDVTVESQQQATPRPRPELQQDDPAEAEGHVAASHRHSLAFAGAVLPGRYTRDGDGHLIEVEPPRPCPELLTEDEAALYLRLDVKNTGDTLRYYREQHGLRAVQVSRQVLYPREELDALWHRLIEENPR